MKVRATRVGFANNRLYQPGDEFEVKQPASWYVPVKEEPASPHKGKVGKQSKVEPAAPAADDLT